MSSWFPFFIPMGTVVTVCMLLTVVFASRFPYLGLNRVTPPVLLKVIGVITGAAGLWNLLWHSLRHITQDWGQMAFGSGLLMTLLSALLIMPSDKIPSWLNKVRPFAVIGLLLFALGYGYKIYSL